ncbi:MAG: undecaprenyl-diphosphate phosphatase [Spirochaetes bacterium]|nr:undecaprenyl-diphosphate phosphatase [Spirochaetota bacterium]
MRTSRCLTSIAVLCLCCLCPVAILADEGPGFTVGPAVQALEPERPSALTLPKVVVLGAIEGLTEFLPVSSTGHLTVAERFLGIGRTPAEKRAADSYTIVIQGGAILAVLLVSLGRIRSMIRGLFGRDREGLRLLANLAIAFVPAAVIGLLLEPVRARLYGIWPIVGAWIVGGLLILLLVRERSAGVRANAAAPATAGRPLESLTWRNAMVIGLAQAVAIWPGVSRSLVTIAAGLLLGLSVPASVEFSFLLGLLTLGAATGYEAVKSGGEIVAAFGVVTPIVGFAVAAVCAFIAVRWMVSWLKTRSLSVFGWYRIGIGAVVAALAIARLV